ncbi:YidC/Oxa1 family membrane protein insertase [Bradyrhizobium sp. AZCC 1614]
MTDNRNTILAVILSGLVLIAWQYFYNMPQMERQRAQQQTQAELNKSQPPATPGATPQPGSTPSPGAPAGQPAQPVVNRDTAIAASPRIKIETPRISGSIALKGARIDDLALEKFRDTVDPKSPAIVLFSPSGTAHPYYAEFGWVAASGSAAKLPDRETVWQQERLRQPESREAGHAEMGQWRRSHLPPHHCDRRPLSLHHQGRRHQRRQCAGHALSVRPYLPPRHAGGLGLLHPA